jgi:hypothetical protein
MKNTLVSITLLAALHQPGPARQEHRHPIPSPSANNIFIITIDGFRWQEIFNGADSALINDPSFTADPETMNLLYQASTKEERREKLMPFFWKLVSKKGQLYGNRSYGNKMNVSNGYSISYPGYNEILTGNTDEFISSNNKYYNPNTNLLEYLNNKEEFHGKVAAFTSWNVFPYILNQKRNDLPVNSGYDLTDDSSITTRVQNDAVYNKKATRHDALTFVAAKEYIEHNQPRILYLGLGETDEFAHDGRYDLYLQQATSIDRMLAELWHLVQTTAGYKDNTIFIITTDHGRGSKHSKWASHGPWIKGSSQTWLAVMGPGIEPLGEIKENQQFYQVQLAQTISELLGEDFSAAQPVAAAIPLVTKGRLDFLAGKTGRR